jgi:Photosynthesis system II assembly factor YCF48
MGVTARVPLTTAGLLICALAHAADPPVKIEYACPAADVDSFGLSCSTEDPCPVFLELSSVDAIGSALFVTGNLHTQSSTLYAALLSSEDGGKTWTEPIKRLRAAVLEQIQFVDFTNGWISGQTIEPLPRDPFLLLTTDGGKTWRQHSIFEESRFGSIAQFWFESKTAGELVVDHSERGAVRHEVYQTNTGGESWEVKESTTKPVTLKGAKEQSTWRIRADAGSKAYHLERRGSPNWELVASFTIHVADCK